MKEIKIKYKGFTIEFQEQGFRDDTEKWALKDDNDHVVYENEKLKSVKAYVDRLGKTQFVSFQALYNRWHEGYKPVTVTSIDEKGEYWIKNAQGRREKVSPSSLLVINEKNTRLLKEIEVWEKKQTEAGEKKQELKEQLETYEKELAEVDKE